MSQHEIFNVPNILPERLTGLRLDFGNGRWIDVAPLKHYQKSYADAQIGKETESWVTRADWITRFGVKGIGGLDVELKTETVKILGRECEALTLDCLDAIPGPIQEQAFAAICDLTLFGKLDEKRLDFTLQSAELSGESATESPVSSAMSSPLEVA